MSKKVIESIDEFIKWNANECYLKATIPQDSKLFDVYMEFDAKLHRLKQEIIMEEHI